MNGVTKVGFFIYCAIFFLLPKTQTINTGIWQYYNSLIVLSSLVIIIPYAIKVLMRKKLNAKLNITSSYFFLYLLFQIVVRMANNWSVIKPLYDIVTIVIVAYILITECNNKKDVEFLIKNVHYTSFIGGALVGLIQYFAGFRIYDYSVSGSSIYSKYPFLFVISEHDPNYGLQVLIISLFTGIALWNLTSNNKYKFNVIILLFSILLSGSRSGYVSIFISIFVLLIVTIKNRWIPPKKVLTRSIKFGIFIFPVLVLVLLLFNDTISSVWKTYTLNMDVYKSGGTLNSRLTQWGGVVNLFLNASISKWFIGFGESGVESLGTLTNYYMTTHNFLFEQILIYGIFTAGISFLLIAKFLRIGFLKFSSNRSIFILTCGLLAHLILLQTISSSFTIYFMLYFVLIESLVNIVRKEIKEF